MFHIARIAQLRVYVNVPQESATSIKPGTPASVVVQEADAPVVGAVTRTSHALDASSRTLLAEVQIPNPREQLLPGMFALVRFTDPRPNPPLMVSGETLITRAQGTQVALLEPLAGDQRDPLQKSQDARCARRVRLQPVALGRDYGTQVEITQGLRDGDFVVLNPGDGVRQGALLLPQLQPPQDDAAEGGSGGQRGNGRDKSGEDGKKTPGKAGGGGDPKDGDADEARQRRQQAERTCLEQQASAQAASAAASGSAGRAPASAPATTASTAGAGAPTDKAPAGIRSPSIQAPTQGQKKPGGSK